MRERATDSGHVAFIVAGDVDVALKALKKYFRRDVEPSLRRHEAAVTPGQRKRRKRRLAENRRAREARQAARKAGWYRRLDAMRRLPVAGR